MTRVFATAADAGRSCPYCRFPLKEGVVAEHCGSCNSLYHEDCWRDGGGCAVLGCSGVGTATATVAAPAAWPGSSSLPGAPTSPPTPATPQIYPGYGAPAGLPAPQPHTYATPSPSKGVLVVAAIVALLGVGAGVLVATGALSGGARAGTRSAPTPAATQAKAQAQTAPTQPVSSGQASDRGAVMSLLSGYQRAYSDHDISRLSRIFAPAVRRHGLAAGGCTVAHGRGSVLADYQSQFAQDTGSYELIGLSEGKITFDSQTRAHLDAHYRITPGGTGYVNFRFAKLGEGWKISEIYATCE